MHKRLLIAVAAALAAVSPSFGQNAYDAISQDVGKAGGIYYVDDFPAREATPAPKGYKPFYISAYTRHGARYILREEQYTNIHKTLEKAFADGNLTPAGEAFRESFGNLYKTVRRRAGELTDKGWKQGKEQAARMYAAYPEIFKKNPHIEAYSTDVPRAIMTMAAFCESLKEHNHRLEISQESSKANLGWLNPLSGASPNTTPIDQRLKSKEGLWYDALREMTAERVDIDKILGRLFADVSLVRNDRFELFSDIFDLASDSQCLDTEESYWHLFTDEEIKNIWECQNFRYYSTFGPSRYNFGRSWQVAWEMLDDIIRKADDDMGLYPEAARLRFGHDGCIMALLTLMNADSWGVVEDDRDKVRDIWQTYNIPMATSLQFVFYKAKNTSADDALLKVLLNGKELTLPFESVTGPYYKWGDFKNHYQAVVAEARKALEVEPANITGKVTCGGVPVEGVQVSDGKQIVTTDKNGDYRIFSDKGQGFVFITTPSGYVATSTDGVTPSFWSTLAKPVQFTENHNFTLKKEDQTNYSIIFMTDAHLTSSDTKPDLETFHSVAMPNVKALASRLSERGPVYSMNLGDFAHELYWYSCGYNLKDAYETLLKENYPTLLYSVSGNHDNDGAVCTDNTDRDAEHLYRSVFGPEYYAVNIGEEHWIMMDDIIYVNNYGKGKKAKGIVGDRSYHKGFTKDEMEWLANDLASLPDTARIRLCVHAPLTADNENQTLFRPSQMDSIAAMFKRFGTVYVQCGHVHRMQFFNSEKYPMFREAQLPAISGDMWTSSPIRTIGIEGEDGGVFVAKFSAGSPATYEYQTNMYGEKVMRVYDMNTVGEYYRSDPDIAGQMSVYPERNNYGDRKYRNWVYVNYWCWRQGETVEIIENGKPLDVVKVEDEDPVANVNYYLPYYKKHRKFKASHSHLKNHHMFAAKTVSARSKVLVRVRDAEGEVVYEETLARPKAFSPEMR